MQHARLDFQAIQPYPTKRPHIVRIDGQVIALQPGEDVPDNAEPIIPDDEPILLVRGQDPQGWWLCLEWARQAEEDGVDPEVCRKMRVHAMRMKDWWENHGKRKVATVPLDVMRPED